MPKGVPISDELKAKMKAGRDLAKAKRLESKTFRVADEPSRLDNPNPIPPPEPEIKEPPAQPEVPPQVDAEQSSPTATTLLIQKLMAEMAELKKQVNSDRTPEAALEYTAQMQGQPVVGKNGIQGKLFKYPVEPSYYPNPIEKLYAEPTLSRHNLKENYFLDWEVTGVEYEKYGVTYAEPKFTIRLFRRLFDDDGITPSGRFALINRHIQHEDEVVARSAADKLGITEQFENFAEMMNEMRYHRIRNWLLELFTPVKVTHHNRMPTQEVIAGKVVEVFDTEALIDGSTGQDKARAIQQQTRF